VFAVVQCTSCRAPRIVDLDTKLSSCPFCTNTDSVANLRVICRSRSQAKAREELTKLTSGTRVTSGFDGEIVYNRPSHAKRSSDPWSTLEHDYEKAHGLEEKILVISKGLPTVCGGEFTEDDLLRLDPKNGRKILSVMLDRCVVHETKYGHYKA